MNMECTHDLMESTLKYSWVSIVGAPCVLGAISSTDVGFRKSVNNIHLCVFQWESEDGVSNGTTSHTHKTQTFLKSTAFQKESISPVRMTQTKGVTTKPEMPDAPESDRREGSCSGAMNCVGSSASISSAPRATFPDL
jgi:hypothetical protein